MRISRGNRFEDGAESGAYRPADDKIKDRLDVLGILVMPMPDNEAIVNHDFTRGCESEGRDSRIAL
jgi:hypothetical protein